MMIRLGVNIDHVATVRQARRAKEPDPVIAAALAVLGGADGITVHLREDRRHIQDRDLRLLSETITVRLNLEMACTDEMITIAKNARPDEVTLVPEKRQELTTEGGLDLVGGFEQLRAGVAELHLAGLHVSLFIDPRVQAVELAKKLQADAVELHTGLYADAVDQKTIRSEFEQLHSACELAESLKMHVHLGHGLNYQNIVPVLRIPAVEEVNIGHSIVSRAVLVGMESAVREMKQIIISAVK
jgi:pyridoxine 5-phosphate synthase